MKNLFKILLSLVIVSYMATGCIEETYPTQRATADQILGSSMAMQGLANSTASFMNKYNNYNSSSTVYQDFGYPAEMIIREILVNDFPVYGGSYCYFKYPWGNFTALGETGRDQPSIWYYYYSLINNAHSLIRIVDPEEAEDYALEFLGSSLCYRALAYMDLTRMFEYKHTGTSLDAKAQELGIMGLTVPIVDEKTSEEMARNNPRAPFYTMYRFIMNDLNDAEKYLADYRSTIKSAPDLISVYGLKARLWLEMASRFRIYPQDLQTQISHEGDSDGYSALNITSAQDCYKNAALYARKAISESGLSPLTEAQWHNELTGFTDVNAQNSWIWAIIIGEDGVKHNYINYIGNVSPEQTFGVSNSNYSTFRMIDKNLFNEISDNDWRKTSWIDPADAGKGPGTKYNTILSEAAWNKIPAYVGLKFRPAGGNGESYKQGAAIDLPVMRIEEMYFIEAEALAYANGIGDGVSALESFMNTYRYKDGSYSCGTLAGIDEFVWKLLIQKRVEFWGEGLTYFDYKRLELPVTRGYSGTNHIEVQQFNSIAGYVAPWMNISIPQAEATRNLSIVYNPDPTTVSNEMKWKQ